MPPLLKPKTLEHRLQQVAVFDRPKITLEQYTTTPHLAANVLYSIESEFGDIEERVMADLGCGCGILTIGATLLGASWCVGFEIDPDALDICSMNLDECGVDNCEVLLCDVKHIPGRWDNFFDTVVMNPPFGTRNQGADVGFVETGLRLGSTVYSLHKSTSRAYFLKKAKEWGVTCQVVAELKFDLPSTYKFHTKKSVDVFVDLMRFCSN